MSFHRPKAHLMEVLNVGPMDESISSVAAALETSISYINRTSDNITIVTRSGLSYAVPPLRPALHGDFIIRVVYKLRDDVNTDIHGLLSGIGEESPTELKVLRDALLRSHKRGLHERELYGVDYFIRIDDLKNRGGNLYLSPLDLVVSCNEGNRVALHPYSEPAARQRLIEAEENLSDDETFTFTVRIVDNNGKYGPRYLNINNRVYKVPVSKNNMLRSGVYVTSSGSVEGNYDEAAPVCLRYSFEEADKEVGLFHSFDEAKTLGNVHEARKRELDERSHELKLQEQKMKIEKMEKEREIEELKRKYDREKMELENKIREREIELQERAAEIKAAKETLEHKRRMDELYRKYDLENRYDQRKETIEWLKLAPIIISALTALFVAMKNTGGEK